MTALTLFKNLDRDLNRPFWFSTPRLHNDWGRLTDHFATLRDDSNSEIEFSYDSRWDDKEGVWMVTVEAPGVKKENIKIDSQNDYLVISAEKTAGFQTGKFEKRFVIPKEVDAEKIEASFEDGILQVKLPTQEKKAAKTISIK